MAMQTEHGTSTVRARQGLILVGHGTRAEQGLAEFWSLAKHVAALARDHVVEPCFLELAEPAISTACERLISQGITRLTVSPVLLFAAGHAKRDIPATVEQATQGAALKIRFANTLECHPKIVQLSTRRFDDALAGRTECPDETLLLLVSRGNSDPEAQAMIEQFARLRIDRTRVARIAVCYAAVAKPSIEEALRDAAQSSFRRVVVQPHLLFRGEVLQQIGAAVERVANEAPDQEWILTDHLGPALEVAEAIVELARLQAPRSDRDEMPRLGGV